MIHNISKFKVKTKKPRFFFCTVSVKSTSSAHGTMPKPYELQNKNKNQKNFNEKTYNQNLMKN